MSVSRIPGLAHISVLTLSLTLSSHPVLAQIEHSAPTGTGSVMAMMPDDAAERARMQKETLPVTVTDGLTLDVWAPPGLVTDPLTLDLDSRGRAFVVSSNRAGMLLDIRGHSDWIPVVHSLETTEALRAFFREQMAPERSDENDWLPDFNEDGSRDYRDLTVVAETVFRVEDTDGDGFADYSQVVHEGLNNDIAADIAGGILHKDGDLYVTIAPDLWKLTDTSGDGIYDTTESISHGYSVHPAFSGHDMSALATGPDGRLYWKIGDIGMNVVDDTGRRWAFPNTGAVLRSEFDGSNFEVFAWGLRNTQEIAFDKHGNLVSVDNDGDHSGETERVVYIVQGSDAGWRTTWQYGKYTDDKNNGYNVWMDEGLSRTRFDGQAAYITPPIAPHHAGPSGFAYNPGTALDSDWQDYFFVTSFTGGASNASLYGFQLTENGAGFDLANNTQMLSGLLSSGIAFGADGALYLTDWVSGWGSTGEGALWRLDSPDATGNTTRQEVQSLLNEDFGAMTTQRLRVLMGHADMRIRQLAQFELVSREELMALLDIAATGSGQLARLHAIWGLGQLARAGNPSAADAIRPLLDDTDPEVRAQTAKTLGDVRDGASVSVLIDASADPAPRVRFFATEALGRIGDTAGINAIVAMLADNNDEDAYLRTAGYHALYNIGDAEALTALSTHPSAAVRVAAVVALRRMKHPGVAAFITDSDDYVATEAARAINDEKGITEALPALASALEEPVSNEAFIRRTLSANLRIGDEEAVHRTLAFIIEDTAPENLRLEAIAILAVWPEPSVHDRVDGAWLGQLAGRETEPARTAAANLLPLLETTSTSEAIKVAILDTATALEADNTADYALRRLQQDQSPEVRIAALISLGETGGPNAEQGVALAMTDHDSAVRMTAISAIPEMPVSDDVKVTQLDNLIRAQDVTTGEKQNALTALGLLTANSATVALSGFLDQFINNTLDTALQLDLLFAVTANGNESLLTTLENTGIGRELSSLATAYPQALTAGGNPQQGQQVVLRHQAAQCARCHAIGQGTSDVGPRLDNIGNILTRSELLEALLDPSARIAEGFGEVDTASAMPPMGAILTMQEMRDVVEYLAGLTGQDD